MSIELRERIEEAEFTYFNNGRAANLNIFYADESLVTPFEEHKSINDNEGTTSNASPKENKPDNSAGLILKTISKFLCETCGNKYSREANLNLHITSVHTKIENFSCGLCKYSTSTEASLREHISRHHKSHQKSSFGKNLDF